MSWDAGTLAPGHVDILAHQARADRRQGFFLPEFLGAPSMRCFLAPSHHLDAINCINTCFHVNVDDPWALKGRIRSLWSRASRLAWLPPTQPRLHLPDHAPRLLPIEDCGRPTRPDIPNTCACLLARAQASDSQEQAPTASLGTIMGL